MDAQNANGEPSERREKSTAVRVVVAAPVRSAIARAASDTGQNVSALIREVLLVELTRRGYWPPVPADGQ